MNDNGPKATFEVTNMVILKISKKLALIISMKTFRTYLPNYLQSGLRFSLRVKELAVSL